MKFLLPKQSKFFEHFRDLNLCIKEITNLFHELSISFENFDHFFVRAQDIKRQGDDLTHDIISFLNQTFITPFDREDIYTLAKKMNTAIYYIQKTIEKIYIYNFSTKREGVDEFVILAVKASNSLDQLVSECFEKQKSTPKTQDWIREIHALNTEADLLYQRTLRQLFSQEKDPVLIIQWKDVIENLAKVVHRFQIVSNTMEGIIVKSS